MRIPFLPGLAALAFLLAACASATPYQPHVPHEGGYSEQRIDSSHWRVVFSGNSLTSRETVERYLLYRAAELTVQQGFDWFETTRSDTEAKSRLYVQQDPFYMSGFGLDYGWGWRPYWRYYRPHIGWRTWQPGIDAGFWGDTAVVQRVTRYVATTEIDMGKGPQPADRKVLDAREVMGRLGPGIVLPEAH